MKRIATIMLFLLLTSAAASCFRQSPPSDVLRGRLLVWHTWPEPYSGLIEASLKSFTEVNPDVLVVSEYVDAARLEARFLDQTAAGLGPDLILGTTPAVVSRLVDQGLLIDLASDIDMTAWPLYGVDALRLDDALYAVPKEYRDGALAIGAELDRAAGVLLVVGPADGAGHGCCPFRREGNTVETRHHHSCKCKIRVSCSVRTSEFNSLCFRII